MSGGSSDETDSGEAGATRERRIHHLIASASYESADVIPVSVINNGLEQIIAEEGADCRRARSWTSANFIEPGLTSLSEAWQGLTDQERGYIHDNMPGLHMAIYLLVTGTSQKITCSSVSRTGNPCRVIDRPNHTVHMSEPLGEMRSCEVWGDKTAGHISAGPGTPQ